MDTARKKGTVKPSEEADPWFKRPLDLSVLVASHVVLFPVIALLWVTIPLAIWLEDRGPVFFQQRRVGKRGEHFTQIKFRTMLVDADQIGPIWTSSTDSRVTKTGMFLRRTALDEIPQVINIWKGDMSIVGPRPLSVEEHDVYVAQDPSFVLRVQVRPGLTGPAAINLPRRCPPDLRMEGDLYYIQHRGLWLDIKLIMQSVWLTLTGQWGSGPRRARESDTHAS